MPNEEEQVPVDNGTNDGTGDVVEGETLSTTETEDSAESDLNDLLNNDPIETMVDLNSPYLVSDFAGYSEIPIGITLVLILFVLIILLVMGRRSL